ncbi:MAG TPA: tRNA (adenosine(37)-N6)-threonylcarbamoyltransferase complex ATPase subunit type 1 TsaE [Blastocatellia bacterium]|nr:tRNA (adenosine(37)-N6)-threonylcarbamoyltransferase complex ATPase subunit type 1 TsaE [Blastocatellia bacterium]
MKDLRSSDPETTNQKPENYFGEFTTHSPEETFELARSIGEHLEGGEIFLLSGELGAGKTVFAKGLAAGLDIDPSDVTSPTFTLVNAHEGRLRFYHVDLYRLDAGAHLGLGLDEILGDDKAVTLVEWAERLALVPTRGIAVEMVYVSTSDRQIAVSDPN